MTLVCKGGADVFLCYWPPACCHADTTWLLCRPTLPRLAPPRPAPPPDYVRWLLGEDPISVYATGSSFHPELKVPPLPPTLPIVPLACVAMEPQCAKAPRWVQEEGILDTALMLLKFPSGAMCTIDMSRTSAYGYDQRCEVYGSKGMTSVRTSWPPATTCCCWCCCGWRTSSNQTKPTTIGTWLQVENLAESTNIIASTAGIMHDNPEYSFPQRFRDAFHAEVALHSLTLTCTC